MLLFIRNLYLPHDLLDKIESYDVNITKKMVIKLKLIENFALKMSLYKTFLDGLFH